MQQKNKLIQKDTLHAKQSQVTKSQNDFPNKNTRHYQKRNKSLRRQLNKINVKVESVKKPANKKSIGSFSIINFLNRSSVNCLHNLAYVFFQT